LLVGLGLHGPNHYHHSFTGSQFPCSPLLPSQAFCKLSRMKSVS
jgi:hypothetical protein